MIYIPAGVYPVLDSRLRGNDRYGAGMTIRHFATNRDILWFCYGVIHLWDFLEEK